MNASDAAPTKARRSAISRDTGQAYARSCRAAFAVRGCARSLWVSARDDVRSMCFAGYTTTPSFLWRTQEPALWRTQEPAPHQRTPPQRRSAPPTILQALCQDWRGPRLLGDQGCCTFISVCVATDAM